MEWECWNCHSININEGPECPNCGSPKEKPRKQSKGKETDDA